jgi:ABC-type glutathione transport system ATPase component
LRPKVLIADEPTSMVDACVRANILDYLMKLKQELQMTIIFVTHDIGLAYYVSDRLFIMHEGKMVDAGKPDDVILRRQVLSRCSFWKTSPKSTSPGSNANRPLAAHTLSKASPLSVAVPTRTARTRGEAFSLRLHPR